MKHYKKHIDNFFKEKLGNYRETPPPDAWSELETRLDGLKPGAPGLTHRWVLHVAIVSSILLLSVPALRKMLANTTPVAGTVPSAVASNNANSSATTNSTATRQIAANLNAVAGSQNAVSSNSLQTNQTNNNQTNGNQITGNQINISNSSNNTSGVNTRTNGKNSGSSKRTTGMTSGPGKTGYVQNANPSGTATSYKTTNNHYSVNSPNPSPEETNDNNQSPVQAASPNTTLSVVTDPATAEQTNTGNKQPVSKPSTSTANNNSRTRNKADFQRLEAGVKVGYEGGFSNGADNKAVVSPYLQYNLSPSLSVMTQPGVKFAITPNTNIGAPQTYYNVNQESTSLKGGQTTTNVIGLTTYYTTPYTYTQTHDSIIKSNKIGGTSMQYELPILLKYKLTKKLSVYGGVNFVYNKSTTITENTYSKSVTRTVNDTVVSTSAGTQPNISFNYAGNPISDYKKLSTNQTGYELSTGYMIGFSYACSKKWMFDALMEQNPVSPDMKAGYNINTPLSVPYFRLSVGYNITK